MNIDSASKQSPSKSVKRTPLYIAIWRWHFYAGLFVIPFVVLLALTGSVYLFRPQIETYLYRDLLLVTPHGKPLTADQLLQDVRRELPTAQISGYQPPNGAASSAMFVALLPGHRMREAFLNPYTGALLGVQDPNARFMQRVRNLHGKLLAGKQGQFIVETAGGWAFVLLVSGLFLWFPKHPFSVWGSFLPRLRSGRRVFWRDLHAVPAVYLSGLLCFLIASGMPWSLLSGTLIKRMSDSGRDGSSIANSNRYHSQLPIRGASVQDWLSALSSTNTVNHSFPASNTPGSLSLDRVAAIARSQGLTKPFQIIMPQEPHGIYTVRTIPDKPQGTVFLHLDQYSGRVLAKVDWEQLSPLARAVSLGIAAHEGHLFGLANQLLGLAACLTVLLVAFSGGVMWWRRRPSGRLGAPRLAIEFTIPPFVIALLAGLAMLFPAMGISLVIAFFVDRYVLPKLPHLRKVLT